MKNKLITGFGIVLLIAANTAAPYFFAPEYRVCEGVDPNWYVVKRKSRFQEFINSENCENSKEVVPTDSVEVESEAFTK